MKKTRNGKSCEKNKSFNVMEIGEERYCILGMMGKYDPILLSDRSFHSLAYENFSNMVKTIVY